MKPLSVRMRPENLEDFVGQEHLVGEGKPIRVAIEKNEIPSSIILWGPTGCGKTTLARLLARLTNYDLIELSAVTAGKDDVRKAINRSRLFNRTILFLDEIHRFNKSQQDFLLPFVENKTILLIGATTENPSFEINSALLSRSKIFVLKPLSEKNIKKILKRAVEFEGIKADEDAIEFLSKYSNGDARVALNSLETASLISQEKITLDDVKESMQKFLHYDKNGEEHYNLISAFHKSIRDGDKDAAIYWMMRMLEAGEDPKYIARRLMRIASEDIGNADPFAIVLTSSVKDVVDFVGMPECDTALAQAVEYLSDAKKSNSCYEAINKAQKDVRDFGNLPVPLHLRNAPTKLLKDLGYGRGYKYAHNFPNAKVNQQHFPEELKDRKYFKEKGK